MSPNPKENTTGFFKPDGAKPESIAIDIPSISLPNGGGGIKGMDEKFSVNPVNGTASFSIPLPFSKAREELPALSLNYNSGTGNGIFGLGWKLDLPCIQRKTDKSIPQYLDATDSDVFLFSDAEDLVPEFKKSVNGSFLLDENGEYIVNEKTSQDGLFFIRYYKPKVENLYARIERWLEKSTNKVKWKITTKENKTTLYGWTDNTVISDPGAPSKIFKWFPEFVFDDKGNCTHYIYKKENLTGLNPSLNCNKNRCLDGEITYTNLYLNKVLYGNKTAYKAEEVFPIETDYMFQTVFDYATVLENESPVVEKKWDYRADPFSDYKAGFEVRTTRLCKRVLLFHVFEELAKKEDKSDKKTLIKSLDFAYDNAGEQDFMFLKSIVSSGYVKKEENIYARKKFPPLDFEYQKQDWSAAVNIVSPEDLVHLPAGIDGDRYQFTDLYNEGLNGILSEQMNAWYYKQNLGNGKFGQAKLVKEKPSFAGLGTAMQLVDLDGNGSKQLVSYGNENPGYFALDDQNEWEGFRAFNTLPNIDFKDTNTRMLDLNGDGRAEVVITEDNVFTWYLSDGTNGFLEARKTIKPYNEEEGPNVLFSENRQSVFLADMSGDGMKDIVRIRNGEVCYWSNLGYGKFGAKIAMDNAPYFDFPEAFNPTYLKLVDIDGSGTTDIIYLGKNKFSCWKNLSGNRFSASPFEIDAIPEIHAQTKVSIADFLGNGSACIIWSNTLSKEENSSLKYIDLTNGKKPNMMTSYKNNLGKKVSFEYRASTKYYLEDKRAGKPWVTKLHFPIQCISKTITEDIISGYKFVREYKYHHGYFDQDEREFHGFGMVEQIDAETYEHWVKGTASNIVEKPMHQEPIVNRTWHHTGAFLGKDKILNQFKADYWYAEMARKGFSVAHCETELPEAQLRTAEGIDPNLINELSVQEWKDALRACKGLGIRTEIFAKDAVKFGNTREAIQKELTPFSVATRNCEIELVQPKGKNRHAIFAVKESESRNYGYERNVEDPRICHTLNIQSDAYGNVLETASVVYPRRINDPSLPSDIQEEQSKTSIIYAENVFTNDVINENTYRLRLVAEKKSYELRGVVKAGTYYKPSDFRNILCDINSKADFYHEMDTPIPVGKVKRRLIKCTRSNYYRNDLLGALPFGQMGDLGILFEDYQLAYTPELITNIYGTKVTANLLAEGKFIHLEGDNNWWVRSGSKQYIGGFETYVNAQNRFFVPVSYTDANGGVTNVTYYSEYFLNIASTEDPLGNKTGVEVFNFRTLSAQKMKDVNGNYSEVITNELGMVKAMAVMGKGNQADELTGLQEYTDAEELEWIDDFFKTTNSVELTVLAKKLLKRSSTYFVYDFDTILNQGKPVVSTSIVRETHYRKSNGTLNPESKVQIAFEYSNGMEEVIMKKVQATPGEANEIIVNADNTITVNCIDTGASSPKLLRWIGTGRIIKNNKGKAVKEYEPYFSVSPHYEDFKELVEKGVTHKLFYDALGRLLKTEMPNGTFSKREFDAWKQIEFDANDTVLESLWYNNRTNRLIDAELLAEGKNPGREKLAADKAAKHAMTPNVLHFDTVGRPIISVEHNKNGKTKTDDFYQTKLKLDVEGNLQTVIDSRDNKVVSYKYDMLGNQVFHASMDSGKRWLFTNIQGSPLRKWDERQHEFQYFYDGANRLIYSKVLGGDGVLPLNNVFDKIIYGENLLLSDRSNEAILKAQNVLGKVVEKYDTGGMIATPAYDLKGESIQTTRRLFRKYKEVVNWTGSNLVSDLEEAAFTFSTEADAFGRVIKQTTPDQSRINFDYNESGLLASESILKQGATAPLVQIRKIDYNEKGQRKGIVFGNNVSTKFYYDKETFRLKRLESKRQNGDRLQDLYYTFDPVGNITHIEDKNIPVTFFDNQKITGVSEYTYDALYRLVQAKGRENNTALHFGAGDNWNDQSFLHEMNTGDGMGGRNYTQSYAYDAVGNMTQMKHLAPGGNWTRNYNYESLNNRLKSTHIGDNKKPANYTKYSHHAKHGYLEELPHLECVGWNFKEELVLTSRQHCSADNIPETTYYQYDGEGQRIRKITESQATAGAILKKKEERIYIAGYECYKKHSGKHTGLERVSLRLSDQAYCFAIIETRNTINDGTEKELVRYQLRNHIGSSSLELDGTVAARVISYEEYHPYGTTAYQARNKEIKAAAKRYRYTGMERDEETGLEYHSARYYIPWLGRWLSSDPLFKDNQPAPVNATDGNEGGGNAEIGSENEGTEAEKQTYDPEEKSRGSGESDTQDKRQNPILILDFVMPYSERLTQLKNMNLYAYGAQNPMVYIDPTGNVAILQAWWDGYSSAGDGGKVGFVFLFLFAWLAHVIINLVILVASVTILNPGGLFGALDFTWGAPQSIIGLGLGIIAVLFGADVRPHNGIAAEIELPAYMTFYSGYGVSLGPFTFGGDGFSHWDHEAGHTWQSRLLGPLYLFVVGIPSAAGAKWTETWADAWGM